MACYRPTTLKLASAHCPRALDYYEQHRPAFRDHFGEGIAAHDCLAEVGELARQLQRAPEAGEIVQTCEHVAQRLMTFGRTFEGEQEPPMAAEVANAGRDLAIRWATEHPLSSTARYEQGLAFDASWRPVPYRDPARRFRLILDVTDVIEDGDGETYSGRLGLVSDYKSSWATNEAELDTYQMKAQAVVASLVGDADLDGIRQEVVSLRSGEVFRRDLWFERGGREQLEGWKREITAYMDALDKMVQHGQRPARPGLGCVGCPWRLGCEPGQALLMFAAQHVLELEPEQAARALAVNEAQNDALKQICKLALAEQSSMVLDDLEVGYFAKGGREATAAAAKDALDYWLSRNGDLDGFMTALRPGVTALEAVAKKLHKGDKAAQAELLAKWTQPAAGRQFSVRRKDPAA